MVAVGVPAFPDTGPVVAQPPIRSWGRSHNGMHGFIRQFLERVPDIANQQREIGIAHRSYDLAHLASPPLTTRIYHGRVVVVTTNERTEMNIATHIETTTEDLADIIEALELFNGIDEGENTDADRLDQLIENLKRAQQKILQEERLPDGAIPGRGIALAWPSR